MLRQELLEMPPVLSASARFDTIMIFNRIEIVRAHSRASATRFLKRLCNGRDLHCGSLIASGIVDVAYQAISGPYRQVRSSQEDGRGVRPTVRHHFLFGAKPS